MKGKLNAGVSVSANKMLVIGTEVEIIDEWRIHGGTFYKCEISGGDQIIIDANRINITNCSPMTEMSKTYEYLLHEAFCKSMENNHGKDWIRNFDPEEQENMRREFYAGAEWFKSLFPMMRFPPCIMPEEIERPPARSKSKEGITILAETSAYIIFYKHGGCEVAYREYWIGHENNRWRWKAEDGGYIDEDKILCWMKNEFK